MHPSLFVEALSCAASEEDLLNDRRWGVPAIIDPATFEMVQSEAARRKREGGRYSGVSIFSGKIKCGECGGSFGAKVWHSTDKYRRGICRFDEVTEAIAQRSAKGERLAGFIRTLEAQGEPVAEFDERLWGAMVDYVTVGVDGGMTVVFRDGMTIHK